MNTEHELKAKNATEAEAVEQTRDGPVAAPESDIVETQDALILVMDMPGVSEKSIRVELEDRVLTVTAEPDEEPEPAMPVAHREFCAKGYRRAFRIYADVHADGIQARLRHGVLKLTLPKAAPTQPRHIRVEAGS